MARLTRDKILSAPRRQAVIEVPSWGGDVLIQELSLSQQGAIARSVQGGDVGGADTALKTFLEGVIDPVFTAADAEALQAQGVEAFQIVVTAIGELSGMSKKAQAGIASK